MFIVHKPLHSYSRDTTKTTYSFQHIVIQRVMLLWVGLAIGRLVDISFLRKHFIKEFNQDLFNNYQIIIMMIITDVC